MCFLLKYYYTVFFYLSQLKLNIKYSYYLISNPKDQMTQNSAHSLKVIQNAIPKDIAYQVRAEFETADYDKIIQERTRQFAREFPEPLPNMPGADEIYYSECYRSKYLETISV